MCGCIFLPATIWLIFMVNVGFFLYQSHGFYGYWFTVSLMNGTFWVKVWYLPTETSFTDQWSRVFNNNIVPYLGGRIHQFDSTINQLLEHLVFLSNQIVFLFPLLLSLFSWRRITTPSRPSSVWQWPTNSWQMWKCYGRPVKTHFWSLLWGSFGQSIKPWVYCSFAI